MGEDKLELLQGNRIPSYSETDLLASGVLPEQWDREILAAVEGHGVDTMLRGGGTTSLEPAGTNIPYRLLDGSGVSECLPWLSDLYRGYLTELAGRASGCTMAPASTERTGVNVNLLHGPGGRYELHVDSNPVTGLLFVTAHDADGGGQLLFETKNGRVVLDPKPGLFITFDARDVPHAVTPLTGNSVRVTVPMNFYREGDGSERDRDDLDAYLYGDRG